MRAACDGNLCELFERILDGDDVNARDHQGWTALTWACLHDEYEIARQLLESDADPDVNGSYDTADTPLSVAATQGYFDLVRLLIAHGANPDIYAGVTAIRAEGYARRNGHHAISEFLLYHEDRPRSGSR